MKGKSSAGKTARRALAAPVSAPAVDGVCRAGKGAAVARGALMLRRGRP